jgi:hypothetical protein
VCAHQPVDLAPQVIVAGARRGQEVAPLFGCARDGRLKQFADASPAMGIHLVNGPVRLRRR